MWAPLFAWLLVGLVLGALILPAEVKAGVELDGVNVEHMGPVVAAAERVWSGYRVPAVITDAMRDPDADGRRSSKHAEGLALDFRVKNLERKHWESAGRAVAAALNPTLYDVVLEIDNSSPTSSPGNRSHLHVEFDPQPAKLTRASGFSIVNL